MKLPLRSLLATTLTLAAVSARAQSPTVITSLPYTISARGTYVLNDDLISTQTYGNLITVNANNVTIDFQGHFIAGTGTTSQQTYGVYADGKSNVTVKNGTIASCYVGITMQGSGDANTNFLQAQIDHMRVIKSYYTGIYLAGGLGALVTNCQVVKTGFTGSGGAGAFYNVGGGATISNCVIDTVTASNGFGVLGSTGTFVRQCTIANSNTGISGGTYQDNLFANCPTPFTGGTNAGGNN